MADNFLLSTKNPFYFFLSQKATQHACILNAPMNVLPQGEVEELTLKRAPWVGNLTVMHLL